MTKEPKQPGVTLGSQNTEMHPHFKYDDATLKQIFLKLLELAPNQQIPEYRLHYAFKQIKDNADWYVSQKEYSKQLPDIDHLENSRAKEIEKIEFTKNALYINVDVPDVLEILKTDEERNDMLCNLFLARKINYYDFSRIIANQLLTYKLRQLSRPSAYEIIKEENKRSTQHRDDFLVVVLRQIAACLSVSPSDLKLYEDGKLVSLLSIIIAPPANMVGDKYGRSTLYKSARKLLKSDELRGIKAPDESDVGPLPI